MITTCTVKVYTLGKMEENTKVNMLKTKKKDTVSIHGLMVDAMKDNGKEENKMDLENIQFQMVVKSDMDSGQWEEDPIG